MPFNILQFLKSKTSWVKLAAVFIILIAVSIIFFGYKRSIGIVRAGSGDNTAGYAWSENIGWLSFNSVSDGSPTDYGVNIDKSTGDLSGYAWSENIGWVSFNRSSAGNPPAAPFNGGSGPIAKYDASSGDITGWMRALSYGGGWDGWIKLQSVNIDSNGDWHGWAWSDMVVGWLSFNSSDSGAGGSAYKVTSTGVQPPTATSLSVSSGNYCITPSHSFSWDYSDLDGDNESRFQFQVDDNSDFSSPEIDRDYTGLSYPSPTTNNQTIIVSTSPGSDQIAYNTIYYWRVKVYDSQGNNSPWVSGASFTTEKHPYPLIDFSWSPENPGYLADISFIDGSTVYGGSAKSSWAWTFQDGNPASSSEQNPIIQFVERGAKQVVLEVADSDGYTCSGAKTVGVMKRLPKWKEIAPPF